MTQSHDSEGAGSSMLTKSPAVTLPYGSQDQGTDRQNSAYWGLGETKQDGTQSQEALTPQEAKQQTWAGQ